MSTLPAAPAAAAVHLQNAAARGAELIVIGGSAGGIKALQTVLKDLPDRYPLPIVALLHLPEDRQSRLPEVFSYRFGMQVREARDKEPIAASTLYFAPAGHHLSIEQDRSFSLSGEEAVNFSRPSIDVLMASAADAYQDRVAAVLLTGASVDGAAGLASIKKAGGLAVVQDPQEAQSPTMPQAAINLMPPDLILSLADIHDLLLMLGTP